MSSWRLHAIQADWEAGRDAVVKRLEELTFFETAEQMQLLSYPGPSRSHGNE